MSEETKHHFPERPDDVIHFSKEKDVNQVDVELYNVPKADVEMIKEGMSRNNKVWKSVDELVNRKISIFERKQRKEISQIKLQVIREAGKYVTKIVAMEGDAKLRRIATEIRLADIEDAKKLTLALSGAVVQIAMVTINTSRIIAMFHDDVEEIKNPDIREVTSKFIKQILSDYYKAVGDITTFLRDSPYARFMDREVAEAIQNNHQKVGGFFGEIMG